MAERHGFGHAARVRLLRRLFVLLVVGLVAIQFVPYGRDHTNPPVAKELRWNTPATRALAQQACFDCHSNLTEWPWYTNVAPISWLTQHDVEDGRAHLNFTEWGSPQEADLEEVLSVIQEGEMPPIQYKLIHSGARLSSTQRQQLADGIAASWKKDPPPGG